VVCHRIITSAGWLGVVLVSVMMSSAVAALMSTADSALMAFSAIVTLDLVQPYYFAREGGAGADPGAGEGLPAAPAVEVAMTGEQPPEQQRQQQQQQAATQQRRLLLVGKLCSLTVVLINLLLVAFPIDLATLLELQNELAMQCTPAVYLGLYTQQQVSVRSLEISLTVGIAGAV
jgi:Na+/proline symporter